MSKRFFGTWPEGVRTVHFDTPKYVSVDSTVDALSRAGSKPKQPKMEKNPPSPLTVGPQIGARRKKTEGQA